MVAAVAVLVLAGCSTGSDAVVTSSDFQFVSPGGKTEIYYESADRKVIGKLAGESLLDEGKQISLDDFAGKVVVLNLWGAWCPPCRAEAPQLQQLQDEFGPSGVQVLGIDVRDFQRSSPQDFVRDRGLTYPSIYDPPARTLLALSGYPRSAVPSTIILDKKHRVAVVLLRDILAKDLRTTLANLTAE